MKVGDLVRWGNRRGVVKEWNTIGRNHRYNHIRGYEGIVVGFNSKGEGGQDFVHVLVDGDIEIFMHFDLEVISGSR